MEDHDFLDCYRHSTSHVMAQAVKRLFPRAKLGIGPPIEDGFYYDFDLEETLTPEDFDPIEAEMDRIIREDHPFQRKEVSLPDARRLFRERGEDYKLELLDGLKDETISIYRSGEFIDLCRGPHLESTGRIKAFKLLSLAGAYWKGDEQRPMLQRLYATRFSRPEKTEAVSAEYRRSQKKRSPAAGTGDEAFQLPRRSSRLSILPSPGGCSLPDPAPILARGPPGSGISGDNDTVDPEGRFMASERSLGSL